MKKILLILLIGFLSFVAKSQTTTVNKLYAQIIQLKSINVTLVIPDTSVWNNNTLMTSLSIRNFVNARTIQLSADAPLFWNLNQIKIDSNTNKGYTTRWRAKKSIDSAIATVSTSLVPHTPNNIDYDVPTKFIRHFGVTMRATISPGATNSPIVWAPIDSTTILHNILHFDSAKAVGNDLQCFYTQRVKRVITMVATPDETLASNGIFVGGSIGDTVAVIRLYQPAGYGGKLTGNGTSWTAGGFTSSSTVYSTTTGLTTFSPSLTPVNEGSDGIAFSNEGTNPYFIRRQTGSTGGLTVGFYRIDPTTGTVITAAPTSSDIVYFKTNKLQYIALPLQTTTSTGFPSLILTNTANVWLDGMMEMYMVTTPLSATSVSVEWQNYKTGSSNYATSYRITRALESSPTVETTVYTGGATNYTDTGLTGNTIYRYYFYATVLGVESKITFDKVITRL